MEEQPKKKRGGPRPGSGRPKNSMTHIKELAICDGVLWYMTPYLTAAGILLALNGDATLLKHWYDRIYGRVEDVEPLIERLDRVRAELPEDFDPEATLSALREELVGGVAAGEWTNAEAARVGRLGVKTLERLAERGDRQAAIVLARALMPDPILTLGEQTQTMTPEQLRETMTRRYSAAWPWLDAAEITRMVDAIQGAVRQGNADGG